MQRLARVAVVVVSTAVTAGAPGFGGGDVQARGVAPVPDASPVVVTTLLDGSPVDDQGLAPLRSYSAFTIDAPGAAELELAFDDTAYMVESDGSEVLSATPIVATDFATLALTLLPDFQGESTTVTVTARLDSGPDTTTSVRFLRPRVIVTQRNLTTSLTGGEGPLAASAGDCIGFTVEVEPTLVGEEGVARLAFPETAFTAPNGAGQCASSDQTNLMPNVVTAPVSRARDAELRLLVSDSVAPGPTFGKISVEVLIEGQLVASSGVDPLVVPYRITARQEVDGQAVGGVARLQPGAALSVSIETPSDLPPGSQLSLNYQAPLVARDVGDVSADPETRTMVFSESEIRNGSVTIVFDVSNNVVPEQRGRELTMSIDLVTNQETVASTSLRQLVPSQLAVERALVEPPASVDLDDQDGVGSDGPNAGGPVVVTPGMRPTIISAVRNNDVAKRSNVTMVDDFDLAFFEVPRPTDESESAPATPLTECTPQPDDGESSGILRCVTFIDEIAAGDEVSLSYPIQIRPALNVGEVQTMINGTIQSDGIEQRGLAPLSIQIDAPLIGVSIVAASNIVPGGTTSIFVEVTNAGPGVAQRVGVSFRAESGAARVQQLTVPDGFIAKPELTQSDGSPLDNGRRFTLELGDVGATPTPLRYEFSITLSDTGKDTIEWHAGLTGDITLTASSVSKSVSISTGSTDRLEDKKFRMALLIVLGPLSALLLLVLLGRWVPGTSQTTVNRLVEGVLVVFLTSTVLVMNLSGGLEAESAAAIIGGIGGYIFGRGVTDVVSDRKPDDASSRSEIPTTDTTHPDGSDPETADDAPEGHD